MKLNDNTKMTTARNILSDLVAIDTTNPPGRNYPVIADVIVSHLHGICDTVEVVGVDEDRPNVVATVGSGDGPTVALNGHVDVVPAQADNWDYPPFELTVDGDRGYGRGTVDMKGGLVAGMKAMELLSERAIDGTVIFTATVNEETGGQYGLKWLIDNGHVDADYWIIMEPTGLDVYRCEKGAYWHRICVHGETAHGSRPHLGTSAIEIAGEAITALNAQTFADVDEHEILGRPTINIGRIEGGDNINSVPDRCTFEVDRRVVPAEDMADVVDETTTIMEDLTQTYDFTYEIEEMVTASPFETPLDDVVVQVAQDTIKRVTGTQPAISGTSGYTDARFPAVQGKPTIILGPGDNSASHIANESIDLHRLERAPPVLAAVSEELLTH